MDDVAEAVAAVKRDLIGELPTIRCGLMRPPAEFYLRRFLQRCLVGMLLFPKNKAVVSNPTRGAKPSWQRVAVRGRRWQNLLPLGVSGGDLHELAPVGGRAAGGRAERRLEWLAEMREDLSDGARLGEEARPRRERLLLRRSRQAAGNARSLPASDHSAARSARRSQSFVCGPSFVDRHPGWPLRKSSTSVRSGW